MRHHAERRIAIRLASHRRGARRRLRSDPASHRIGRFLAGLALVVVGLAAAGVTIGAVAATIAVDRLSQGLPDPHILESLSFAQPTLVTDRTGTIVLARFEREQRTVVAFDDLPKLVLDATTSAEDRTFWDNPGFDPLAIAGAALEGSLGDRQRGASTITQQLVRARLLPPDVTAPGADRYLRKAKEVIQAARVTSAYPGTPGKQRIITAYLNEIFYGHGAYGIAAAARIYFGVELGDLTIAQAALLAGLPQSPTTLDPYLSARPDADGRLVVPPDAPAVRRRDYVLRGLADGARWTTLTPSQLETALHEPVVLAGDRPPTMLAPHFDWRVRRELEAILGSADAVDTGGYRVITTLDWHAQQVAEQWVTAAAIVPNEAPAAATAWLDARKVGRADRAWIERLRGKDLHDAGLVAIDYRTGDILAYVGSAGYERDDLASPAFDPKYDVIGAGRRQPGSAFKPILYATALDRGALTAGSVLLDVTTHFGPSWTPQDADRRERGPVLVRTALQQSLNLPAVRALERVGVPALAEATVAFGVAAPDGRSAFEQAGLAGALGTVEVRPLDMTAAFGALANGGIRLPPRAILEIDAPDGTVVYRAPDPAAAAVRATGAGAAGIVTDILAGNTDPRQNAAWASVLEVRNGPHDAHRPAAVKTGTTDDARDLSTYGYLAPSADASAPALAVGVWMGNSDHSRPATRDPAISLEGPAPLWRAFVSQLSRDWPIASFAMPDGVVRSRIDAWSGGAVGRWTIASRDEWFIDGTQPGGPSEVDPAGSLYRIACGGWRVDPVAVEVGPTGWRADVADWLARARRGVGVEGPIGSRTAFLPGQRTWGGRLMGACSTPRAEHGHHGRGHGHGHPPPGHGKPPKPGASPAPTPAPEPTPMPEPSPQPTPTPSAAP